MKFIICLFLCKFIMADTKDTAPRVTTSMGSIRGYYNTSYKGMKYEAYEGIPYALPPINNLRFEPPEPAKAWWSSEMSATKKRSYCLQCRPKQHFPESKSTLENRIEGKEDCLYLNIYVPSKERTGSKLLPVIFFIPGGVFRIGGSQDATEMYLMDRDLVLVTFNYRIGVLGFLSTEDDVVPGNMGLKDQNLALRWVSKNIQYFRGDPKNVILTGLSAGGASVQYHYLSPMSAGLFAGGISVSGTALDPWARFKNFLEKTQLIASRVNCTTENTRETVECLKRANGIKIVEAIDNLQGFFFYQDTHFGPVVEKSGTNSFLNRLPIDVIKNGDSQKVPWIASNVSEDGLWVTATFVANATVVKYVDENWTNLAPSILYYNDTVASTSQKNVSESIRKEYFGDKKIEERNRDILTRLESDREFFTGARLATKMQAKQSPETWYYLYSHRNSFSSSESFSGTKVDLGVSHMDDALLFIECFPFFGPPRTASDLAMQKELLDIWESFAYTKKPNISQWESITPDGNSFNYLRISGPGQYEMEENANFGNNIFWDSLNLDENEVKFSKLMH